MKVIHTGNVVQFQCPGCGLTHMLNLDAEFSPSWTFNGDTDRPTLTPSINAKVSGRDGAIRVRCHSWVTAGRIQFLADSTQALRGQTIYMPEVGQ